MIANTNERYGLVAQCLHWLMAILILALAGLGLVMQELPAATAADVDDTFRLYSLHKTLGMLALLLALVRIVWAVLQPRPAPLNAGRRWEALAAATVHWLLYGAMLALPLTGWLHHAATEGLAPIWGPFPQAAPFVPRSETLAGLFGMAHTATAVLLGVALAAHFGGAAKHVLIDRDETLRRMLPGARPILPLGLPVSPARRLPAGLALAVFLMLALVVALQPRTKGPAVAAPSPAASTGAGETWRVDPEASRLGIEVIVQGAAVTGSFGAWQAAIRFDPDDLAASHADVRIDVGSLDLGSLTGQALAPDYLDAEAHPRAVFVADRFERTGPGRFQARGRLSLAGETREVVLPFNFAMADGRAAVQGETHVARQDFTIGPEGDLLGPQVRIMLTLSALPPA